MGNALQKDKGNQRRSSVAVCSSKTEFLLPAILCCLKATVFYCWLNPWNILDSSIKQQGYEFSCRAQKVQETANLLTWTQFNQLLKLWWCSRHNPTTHSSAYLPSCSNCFVDLQMGTSLKISDCIYVMPVGKKNLKLPLGYNKVINTFCEPLFAVKTNKNACCRIIRK